MNYRISGDYGMVAVAKSKSPQSDDLFGSAMNLCAKINSKAPANGMVIGEDFYQLVKSLEDYCFERVHEQSHAKYSQYPAYFSQTRDKRNILNPFKRISESKKNRYNQLKSCNDGTCSYKLWNYILSENYNKLIWYFIAAYLSWH